MTIRAGKDACTGTHSGRLSRCNNRIENDEMFVYDELTGRLMTALSMSLGNKLLGSADKNTRLPMRASLFPHVPPYVIFENNSNKNVAILPRQITKHLFWYHTDKYSPRVIRSTVQKSGFTMTLNPSVNWCGTWCSKRGFSRIRSTRNFRKINHFPNNSQLSNKILLWRNFRTMRIKHGSEHFDFLPTSFVLPEEAGRLAKFAETREETWIVKPPTSSGGRGIRIVSRYRDISIWHSSIVQRYIAKPCLIDGFKFDIRLYVLLTSIEPLRIYLYNEGLVRFATVKYRDAVNTLTNKYMHLTNTHVNMLNPSFKSNDNPEKGEGNIWSLSCLWKYLNSVEDVDTSKIWYKIKDIAVKTVISAECSIVKAWRRYSTMSYNFYQLFGFDILLDEEYRAWLLEVNSCPSMEPDTPLCRIVKGQLIKDYLNLIGFHVPDTLSEKELKILSRIYGETNVCYDRRLYSRKFTDKEKRKQDTFSGIIIREKYLKTILDELTINDTRVLIRHEDELAQMGRFEKIFPTCTTYQYFKFFNEVRYYNMLLDAWENKYHSDKTKGIDKLRKLCQKKYHLI